MKWCWVGEYKRKQDRGEKNQKTIEGEIENTEWGMQLGDNSNGEKPLNDILQMGVDIENVI